MRIIKLGILSLFFLFVCITAISLLIPSNITLSKVIVIQDKREKLFSLIKNKEQWPRWHPAFSNSSNRQLATATKSTVLAENDSMLQVTWQQPGKKPVTSTWQLHRDASSFATLQWSMDFHLSWYPWQKLGSLFYESAYGTLMEKGLANLKNEVEEK